VHLHQKKYKGKKKMKNIKLWEPLYVENSKLPIWLSKIAPIDVWAFSFAFWFFAGENYRTKLRGMKLSTINNSWRCYLCLNGYVMGFAGLLDMLSIAMDKKLTTKSPSSNRHMI